MARQYAPNRIREVRKERGFSQEALGGEMPSELTGSTIAKLETGRMALSLDYLNEIATVLDVNPADLLTGGAGSSVRMVPIIGLVAAGSWREAIELTEEAMPIPCHIEGKNLFVLRPDGDSMDRIVAPGAEGGFVVVDPDQRDLVDRKYYVVQNAAGETTFKQFRADPLALLPCSTNGSHGPMPLGAEPFTVVGRVVYAGQEL